MADEVDEAIKNAANQEAEAAAAVAEAAKADAAKHIAEGGAAAAAAAEAAKALAEGTAAETIKDNEENVEWLKQHAARMENSVGQLKESHNSLVNSLPGLMDKNRTDTLAELKTLLTPPPLIETPTKTADLKQASAGQDAQQEAEKKKKKRGPQHKENWI